MGPKAQLYRIQKIFYLTSFFEIARRGDLQLEVDVLRREEERRGALREVLSLLRQRVLLREEAQKVEARARAAVFRDRLVKQREENFGVLCEARAFCFAFDRRLQLLVRRFGLDVRGTLLLDLDLPC